MIELVRRVDGAKVRIPLAGPANRQGRIAATNALGGNMRYSGALGTSVFKAVDYTFAQTGLSEKAALAAGIDARSTTIHRYHHASYYPGYENLTLKLVYTSKGSLLGAQAFGKEGVEKRIDVLATALSAKFGLEDLAELDLSYAPPYSSANDPLQMAAFAAQNQLSGFSPSLQAGEARTIALNNDPGTLFLDVRTYGEFTKGHLPQAVHLPVDELRDRLDELPKDKKIIVVSVAGFEGHLATRILLQHGMQQVAYVSGGMTSLRLFGDLGEVQGE
jgi:rhodanese-related sulfurtransferase